MLILRGLVVVLLMGLIGCTPAHVAWAPDGRHGVYCFMGSKPSSLSRLVIDDHGKTVCDLASADIDPAPCEPALDPLVEAVYFGYPAVRWTADSKSFYFTATAAAPVAADISNAWVKTASAPRIVEPISQPGIAQLARWQDGKVTLRVPLGDHFPFAIIASPDGDWLAIITIPGQAMSKDNPNKGRLAAELIAYHVPSGKLFLLSQQAGFGACFTDDHRLAFVQVDPQASTNNRAALVEVDLNPAETAPQPIKRFDLYASAHLLVATPDGISYADSPVAMSDQNQTTNSQAEHFDWTHWQRSTDSKIKTASDIGFATISPDGHRVLFCDVNPQKPGISVMDADGSHTHTLSGVPTDSGILLPAWHGNHSLTMDCGPDTEIPAANNKTQVIREVANFDINPDFSVRQTITLSTGWPDAQKPSFQKSNTVATTQPILPPSTQPK